MSFRYWAFISYSSKDDALSRRLHHRLETYSIPRDLVGRSGTDGPVPKKLFPCFRDRDELPLSSNLGGSIEDALRASRYLIVICTPASAKSRWVNEEIRYFKSLGRGDRILAIIAAGEPNASDRATGQETECFAPALRYAVNAERQLTNERSEPIAGDLRPGGDGWTNAFLKAVAGITGLGFNAFVLREVKRQRRRQAILAALGLIAVLGGLYAWDYNRTKVNYYATLSEQWGVPQGVGRLSAETMQHRETSYRIESSRGKVRRVLRVNGAGQLQDDSDNFGSALQEVHYRENGQISEIDLSNHKSQSVVRKVFDERQPDLMTQTVELKRKLRDQPFTMAVLNDTNFYKRKSDITAQSIDFDAEGRTERILYLDNFRNPTANDSGVWGLHFQRNDAGLPVEIENIDSDGKPLPDHSGVVSKRFTYDSQGNPTQKDFWDGSNNLILGNQGFARITYFCDEFGNKREEYFFGTDGKASLRKDLGLAHISVKHDEHGNEIEEAYFGLDDKPTMRKDQGTARYRMKYDEHGNEIEDDYFGTDGKPVVCSDLGAARISFRFDERGNVIEQTCFGTDGKPMLGGYGYARLTEKWDDRGNEIEDDYFGTDGKPMLGGNGFARLTDKWDDRGNVIEEAYFGTDGGPILRKNFGFARQTLKWDERGNGTEADYFGTDGKLILRDGYGTARVTSQYDEHGNQIGEESFGTDGQPILRRDDGTARHIEKYDEHGNHTEQIYFGLDGKPILDKDGVARVTKKYDAHGNVIEEENLGLDGKLVMNKQGFARKTMEYDAADNLTQTTKYDEAGQVIK
jgi:hypothetical protein